MLISPRTHDLWGRGGGGESTVGRSAIRGGFSAMAGEMASLVLRIGSTAIFARILAPEYFGLISMVTAVTSVIERFKDLGLDLATIQRDDITHEQVSALFWVNSGIGFALMAAVGLCSPFFTRFYAEPRLLPIALAVSSGFLFGGITIQPQAILRRQMRFAALAWIQLVATVVSTGAGLLTALLGGAYWALVVREVSRPLLIALGMVLVCGWVPDLPRRAKGLGAILRFGGNVTLYNVAYFSSRSLDQILIGRVLGAEALGLYRQSMQLALLPLEQIRFPLNSVAVPTLSAVQGDSVRYRGLYRKMLGALAFATVPIAAHLALYGRGVVALLLGQGWMGAVPTFRILAVSGLVQPLLGTVGFALVGAGLSKRYLWFGLSTAVCAVVGVGVGIRWGIAGVAAGLSVASWAGVVPAVYHARRSGLLTVSDMLGPVWIPAVSTGAMAAVAIAVRRVVPWIDTAAGIPLSLALSIVSYGILWAIVPSGRRLLRSYISAGLAALGNRKGAQRTES